MKAETEKEERGKKKEIKKKIKIENKSSLS